MARWDSRCNRRTVAEILPRSGSSLHRRTCRRNPEPLGGWSVQVMEESFQTCWRRLRYSCKAWQQVWRKQFELNPPWCPVAKPEERGICLGFHLGTTGPGRGRNKLDWDPDKETGPK